MALTYPEMIEAIVKSGDAPRWSKRAIARAIGVSSTTVQNIYASKHPNMSDATGQALRALHKKVCGKG